MKINTDASVRGDPGSAAIAGVAKDHLGRWLVGFQSGIGITSSTTAECWAILKGLELAWSNGFRKVLLESDFQLAINALKVENEFDPNQNVLLAIKE